jgi:hypothetical protein
MRYGCDIVLNISLIIFYLWTWYFRNYTLAMPTYKAGLDYVYVCVSVWNSDISRPRPPEWWSCRSRMAPKHLQSSTRCLNRSTSCVQGQDLYPNRYKDRWLNKALSRLPHLLLCMSPSCGGIHHTNVHRSLVSDTKYVFCFRSTTERHLMLSFILIFISNFYSWLYF